VFAPANEGFWVLEQSFSVSSSSSSFFGASVAVDAGITALVGATGSSEVFVFDRSPSSESNPWLFTQSLLGQPDSLFGNSVALFSNNAVVGANNEGIKRYFTNCIFKNDLTRSNFQITQ
jgi:hypothetical protein